MSSTTYPLSIELGSDCRACELGAGDYYCTCLDEHRCYDCNEKIAWQYEVKIGKDYYHQSCAENREKN